MISNTVKNYKKTKYIELVVLYFKYKNIFDIGFQPYKIFKNKIKYITGIYNNRAYIRNIFEIMLSRNIFQVKFIGKSRTYIFNPYHLRIDNIEKQYIINFN
jgi:hypothetical protein